MHNNLAGSFPAATPSVPQASPAYSARLLARASTHRTDTKTACRALIDRQMRIADTDDHRLLRLCLHHGDGGLWIQTKFYKAQG
jgi:hypothetical protein